MSVVLCPRCKKGTYTPYGEEFSMGAPHPPAVSRADNETYVCSPCGQDEAMEDWFAGGCTPVAEWPVKKEAAV